MLFQSFGLLTLGVSLGIAAPLFAQDGNNVLLVLNAASGSAEQIIARYQKARSVPAENVVRLTTATTDDIDRAGFERDIERPIAEWLGRHSAQDQILYIVLTKGVPLRIRGSEGLNGTLASVDSELTLLYRKLLGMALPAAGRVPNPYFLGDRSVKAAALFSHANADIYLVSRLDGFTPADVSQLIDRGAAPVRDGLFLLDQRANLLGERRGDAWLADAAKALTADGFGDRVVLESSPEVLGGRKPVLGYYSWGSNDPAIKRRRFDLGFAAGSLAAMFVSSDGRTFSEPLESWTLGNWSDPKTFYAGSPQSLAGDIIREGATGVAGHVAEPYLDATIRPQVLFPAYVHGFNLIESFYLAMPYLSWQTVVVGDPLCAPFRSQKLTPEQAMPSLDPDTELPKFFSARGVARLIATGVGAQTARLLLKANTRIAHGDVVGAREPLEMATSLEPRLTSAQLILAQVYERIGDYDKAIERYRAILALSPNEFLSMNNLAYALAVRKGAPAEALPLAQTAYRLSGANPQVSDTLGWIYHLLGQADAERYLTEAAKGLPTSVETHLHLAQFYVAAGRNPEALAALNRAISLDAEVEKRNEVIQLRATLNQK